MPVLPNDRNATVFLDTDVADVSVVSGMCYHQIDINGTVGDINILVDWGTGAKVVKTINLPTVGNLATVLFGDVKSIQLSPVAVSGGYSANYLAVRV